jgi:hypothetical protein
MANTLTVDIIDMAVPPLRPVRIAIVGKPNPVTAEPVTGEQLLQLIQFPKYKITETATGKVVNGGNIYDYFPELQPGGGGGGGGGVTPEQVQTMINASIDSTVSDSSTNAIQNKSIKSYVDTGLSGKASTSSLSPVATSGSYNDLSNKPTIDSELSDSSTNAVQNKVITGTIGDINTILEEVL